jgi:hypothetical protein
MQPETPLLPLGWCSYEPQSTATSEAERRFYAIFYLLSSILTVTRVREALLLLLHPAPPFLPCWYLADIQFAKLCCLVPSRGPPVLGLCAQYLSTIQPANAATTCYHTSPSLLPPSLLLLPTPPAMPAHLQR